MTDRLRLSDHNRRWWTLAAMCFALFMIMLDNTVVNVALPSIQRDFDASLSALEWTLNAYTLTFAVLLITGGRLGDIFGRRRMFLFGVVVFAAASATIGFAPSDEWLVASRAVQGIGAAFMMPGTLSIIANAFPPEERGKAIGTWAGVSAIALALGPLVGGWLTEDVSWRAIFFLNLPFALGAVVVTLFAAEESRDETVSRSVDVPGIATLTVSLTALVLALVEGNAWGWGSARIIGLFVLAAVAAIAFAAIERRSRAPIVDFESLRSKQFLGANVVAFTVTFGMFAMFFFLALYMQNILGYSPLETGVRFLPSTLVIIVAGPVSGRLADKIGPRPLMVTGLLVAAGSLFWQSHIEVDTSYAFLLPAFVLMGAGLGLVMSPMSTAALNAVDRTKAGVASGTLSMFRMIGGTFGIAALGALVSGIGRHDLAQSLPRVPEPVRERLVDGLGSGVGLEGAPRGVVAASNAAFVDALSTGLLIASCALAFAALLAFLLIAPGRPPAPQAEPATDALDGELIAGPQPQPARA
jgi:EmrB/QacA subfamily drug resistance transporter